VTIEQNFVTRSILMKKPDEKVLGFQCRGQDSNLHKPELTRP